MVEKPLGLLRRRCVKRDRCSATGTVEESYFRAAEIIGLDLAIEVIGFGYETGQLRDTRSDIKAPSTAAEPPGKGLGQSEPQSLAGGAFRSPEFFASFVTVDGAELLVIQSVEEVGGDPACCGRETSPHGVSYDTRYQKKATPFRSSKVKKRLPTPFLRLFYERGPAGDLKM